MYHKNTINLFSSLINALLGEGTMVEKKTYEPIEDHMMQQAVETGAELAVREFGGKIAGKIFSKLFGSQLRPLGRGVIGRNGS